jgi:kynurenine 3-monooxygenase
MVPFYGQGMNAGLEDVRILFQTLDMYTLYREKRQGDLTDAGDTESQRELALAEYSLIRAPDAHAINDLALGNYIEMRSSVLSRRYRLRKFLEEFMSARFPRLGWQTKYAQVSFSNEGYKEIIQQSEQQGVILGRILSGLILSPVFIGGVLLLYKYINKN